MLALRPRLIHVLTALAAVCSICWPASGQAEPAKDVLYRHPLGLSFKHPAELVVHESPYGLQLLRRGTRPPRDRFAGVMASAVPPTVKRPDDPVVARYLDTSLGRLAPMLRRTGKPTISTLGKHQAATFRWAGRDTMGRPAAGSFTGILLGRYYVAISVFGPREWVETKATALRGILATCSVKTPLVEKRFVGRWASDSYHSTGRIRNRVNVASTRTMILLPDGTCHAGGHSSFNGQVRNTSLTGLAKSLPEHGRWAARGDRIYFMWDDGTTAGFKIYMQGRAGRREVLLTAANGHKQLWLER